MKTGSKGVALIKEFEGYHNRLHNGDCQAYLDTLAKPAVWTIGYGCTEGVTKGMIWTEAQAEAALRKELTKHEKNVEKWITRPMDQNQFDAFVSLSYNVGMSPSRTATIIDAFNNGDEEATAKAFLLYDKAGGKKIRGLTRRRQQEKELFEQLTPKQVVQASTKLTWLKRGRNLLATVFGGFFTADNLNFFRDWMDQLKSFCDDHKYLLIGGSVLTVFMIFKALEFRSVSDYEDGNYTPSKEAE